VHKSNRLKYPEVREAGTDEWKRVSLDDALSRIAKLMKADRDANFITHNADGKTVNGGCPQACCAPRPHRTKPLPDAEVDA